MAIVLNLVCFKYRRCKNYTVVLHFRTSFNGEWQMKDFGFGRGFVQKEFAGTFNYWLTLTTRTHILSQLRNIFSNSGLWDKP
jgi:hypothetical protein